MTLATRLATLADHLTTRLATLADHLSVLAQWLLYRILLRLEPLRERLPGLGRDPALWAFGARGGEAFTGNAKYLYLHVAAERPEVRPVWLSKDPTVVSDLQSAGYEAYHCYSLRGLLLNLRAGVVLFTQGHRDLAMPCCAGAFAVQLWHGVPLKRISWDAEFPDLPRPVRLAHADMADEVDLLVVPGSALVDTFASGLRIDPDRMALAGYPRVDALEGAIPGEDVATDAGALARVRDLASDGRLVAYLPTYRARTDESVADHLDFAALDDVLAERDATLLVKAHPKESLDVPDDCSRVVSLPPGTDPCPLLRRADALVTDYSSAYVDYLALDRPLVFYPYDRDDYRARRGFYLDYDAVTPGPVAETFAGLLDGLDRALARPEADTERRRAVRRRLLDADPTVRDGDATTDRSEPDESPAPRSATVYALIRGRLAGSSDS
ncbi:CDP-glycerol glycerophosphotransferase family protein [Halorussus halobius]|uniref:CDP-glycerol glycerophosphotransferase family protein n=1 Tax=Halorussus halobius TaxID=1710537 RepID=UPI001092FC25|nr:CDP-glycerol glycerophosphotransferase family protein [Halorussus halobius]